MQLYIVFLFLSIVIFTYSLYLLGREDVIFIRKNVTLEQLFNIFFIVFLVSLFISRLVYILIHPLWVYANPIAFFSIFALPGMSVIGGVIGATLFLLYYSKLRKLPLGRLFDFFTLSFFCALPVAVFGSFFRLHSPRFTESIFLPILYLFLYIFLMKIIFPKLLQGVLKSGSIGLLVILLYSLIWVLTSMVKNQSGIFGFVTIEDLLAVFLFVGCLVQLVKLERKAR